MAELGDLAAPVVGAATGLHGHRAGRQRCEERQKLAAAQLLAKDHRARAVSPMELKDVLGKIEADGADLVHGRLLEWSLTPPLWHAEAVGGVHTIRPTDRSGQHVVSLAALVLASSPSIYRLPPVPGGPLYRLLDHISEHHPCNHGCNGSQPVHQSIHLPISLHSLRGKPVSALGRFRYRWIPLSAHLERCVASCGSTKLEPTLARTCDL